MKAIKWARKYGLRINLDLHAVPGSQNGWNHSGRLGTINFLNGPMGYANAQRTLDYIRILAEFISQPEYSNVVTMFGILNEPQGQTFGQAALAALCVLVFCLSSHLKVSPFSYMEAYQIIRAAGGTGQGNGPFIAIHDGFFARSQWVNVFPNADRLAVDTHTYICFGGQSDADMSTYSQTPCTAWSASVNTSMGAFGLTTAGEFSNAVTDCGLWLNGVGLGTRYEGTYVGSSSAAIGNCSTWTNWQSYDDGMKTSIKNFALASMDALQVESLLRYTCPAQCLCYSKDYFFWTWKIGNSSVTGTVESPAWSYKLGLDNGWMPLDPRAAVGVCGNSSPWSPPFQSWQTGGAGAGQIPASVTSSLAWPPSAISNAGAITLLPSYAPTGTLVTLPVPTFTVSGSSKASTTANAGNGWENPSDTSGMYVPIPTCSYLDPWVGPTAALPSPLCSGGTRRRYEAEEPAITPPPPPPSV